jgi:hypothetical protein
MRFSSFIAITAAGLAIAAPITPITPSNVDKQLTVEPVELYKRGLPDASALTGVLGGGLPVKRGLPDASALTGVLGGGLPVKRGLPDASAVTGVLGGGLPVKRQLGALGGLVPGSSDDSADDDEDVVPEAPKEPKLPSSVADDDEDDTEASDEDADATDSATSKIPIGGLPVGKRGLPSLPAIDSLPIPVVKRQLDGLTGLLGGDKKDPEPTETPAPDATTEDTDDAEETVTPTPSPTPTPTPTPAPAPAGGLGGILKKRQLSGLLGGDKKDAAAADADTVKSKSQSNNADDGTNTPETKFSADEPADETEDETTDETTEEAAPVVDEVEATPAKNATLPADAKAVPAVPAAPAGGLGGLGGLLGM